MTADAVTTVDESKHHVTFTVGTLTYTRYTLVTLFVWLLWGDFVFNLMQNVVPTMLPLLLKRYHTSNAAIGFIVNTLTMLLTVLLNPLISYCSDRTRTRFGRRRPYILITTPMVALFLALIPFAPQILKILAKSPHVMRLLSVTPIPPLLLIFGVLVVCFQIFNMFVCTVYYYMIVDVVPASLIGRFQGLFRVFLYSALIAFNYLLLPLAQSHMRMIFVGVAIVYGACMMLMCWRVKEGQYPPPMQWRQRKWYGGIKTYAHECFGFAYYWWVFLANSSYILATTADIFLVLFYRHDLGFSLAQIGQITAVGGLLCLAASYPAGVLVDRWGSHKTIFAILPIRVISGVAFFLFAHGFWSSIMLGSTVMLTAYLALAAQMKWQVDVYPCQRYGQFASAGATSGALAAAVLSPVVGMLVDWAHSYRPVVCLCPVVFSLLWLCAALVVYRRWRVLGAPDHYHPP